MKYIGWKKDEKNSDRFNEQKIINIYVFNNPITENYDTGFVGVRPKNNDYRSWKIINDVLCEEPKQGLLDGIGIHKDCLFEIDGMDLLELSKKIGIKKGQLESVLSVC